jgi:hypothetical protein
MKLVRIVLAAAALASAPALAFAQSTAGGASGGFFTGSAGAFAGGLLSGTGPAANSADAPLYEGRSVYVPPYPSSLAPGYIEPGPVYVMPRDAPLQRQCRTNVYGERQCEASP